MKKLLFLILFYPQFLLAQNEMKGERCVVSNPQFNAGVPRLTTNHKNQAVLSWVEKDDSNAVVGFYFSTSTDNGKTFSDKKTVSIVEGVSSHAEGMPKVAFKSDGTVIAAYEVKRPTPESRFAGDILYVVSNDGGENWTTPQYVHTDTTRGKGRSFFDISRLANGEIGITWLGEAPSKAGRPLRFTQTTKGVGFGSEITAKEGVCQCCRTNLFIDKQGFIHIYFRDILEDGSRDIGHIESKDGGKTFGNYQKVYTDNWKVAACPHTGPSTALLNGQLFTAWYTGETSKVGVKVTNNEGKILTQIKSPNARHPQMSASTNRLFLVWDEPTEEEKPNASKNEHAGHIMGGPSVFSQINMKILDGKKVIQSKVVSNTDENAALPTVLSTGKSLLVAYELEDKSGKKLIVTRKINDFL
jgi:BNR repeat-like domain